jgi:hypothetical protein
MNRPGKRNFARTLYHLMRADFWERARRYGVLITIGLTIFAAYLYLPSKEADYLTLGLGNYRGVYNSAWIGSAMAVLCSALLSLPAFYLVKNAIERDEQTRVGQIIATTPLSKPVYTLGKAFSNFIFLAVMVGVIALSAIAMQLIRAEVFEIDLWALLSPFVFTVLPAMAMIAALAVLFETLPWLRGTFGNVLYFFLWLAILIATAARIPTDPRRVTEPANDAWGILVILSSMMKDTASAFPDYQGSVAIGATMLPVPLETFAWGGIHWTGEIIFGRLLWVGGAILLSLASALFFRRFDSAAEKPKRTRRPAIVQSTEMEDIKPAASAAPVHLTPLAARKIRLRPASVLLAELRITFKGMPWWWYVIAIGLFVAGLLVPTDAARQWLLPVAWLWPLPLWSSLGSREVRYATSQLVFSAPSPLRSQIPITWLVGVAVALVTGGSVLINLALAGDITHILAWITAALFIPALALALGSWSGGSKLFEVVYLLWWYAGAVNQVETLNFMGTGTYVNLNGLGAYWIGSGLLLGMVFLGRWRQLRH